MTSTCGTIKNASEISKALTARFYILPNISSIRAAEKADVGAKLVSSALVVLNSLATTPAPSDPTVAAVPPVEHQCCVYSVRVGGLLKAEGHRLDHLHLVELVKLI